MSFLIGNQDKFLTNLSVHSINTRNKHHLHRLIANLSCFQKDTSYSGIRIFNNLPQSITSLRNEKPQFKVALNIFYMHTTFTLWMDFLHVEMICITDLYDCVNSYSAIILYVLFAFLCFWHVPHPTAWRQPQRSMEWTNKCMYVLHTYVCMSTDGEKNKNS